MGVKSSILPLGLGYGYGHVDIAGHGLSYTAVSGPALIDPYVHHGPSVAIHAAYPHVLAPSVAVHAAPLSHIPLAVSHSPVVVAPAHEGTYVAKTRGAVHTAPLPGHINSAAAINVAPAPGTI